MNQNVEKMIAKDLLSISAVFLRPDEPFTWASGIKSPIYCDNRLTLTAPAVRTDVETALKAVIEEYYPDVEVLMGTSTAGIAHAAITAHLMNLPMGYVRSGHKDHGRGNQIEGKLEKGQKVVVVEDLISTGGSVLEVVDVLREAGAEVLGVASIFTYGMQKGLDRLAAANVINHSLSNFDTLCEVAAEEGYIKPEDIARETMARCLNCKPREILFTSGGSEADNQALLSAAELGRLKGKKHIISTAFEHHAILHSLKRLEKQGFEVTLLPVGPTGTVTAQQVKEAIRPDTCLVTVMYANNEIGSILPIEEIGAVCREAGVLFHTDAVQAVGHLPIDVKAQHIDMLSLSGHKFHGPKGVGALYVRQGVPITSLIEGGAQERGKRAGTENVPGIAAMAAALEDACAHMEENRAKVTALRDKLIAGLSQIPHSALNGDPVNRLPGNVNFCFEGIEGESLLLLLDDAGICASSGSACTSGSLDPSHVLLAIGRPHEVAHGSLRLSLSEWNQPWEIDHILREVPRVVAYLRSMSPVWKDLESGKKQFML